MSITKKRKVESEYINSDPDFEYSCWNRVSTRSKKAYRISPPKEIARAGDCERVKEDHGHRIFPNEIWEKIFSYLLEKDLWILTVVCKAIRYIVNTFLWEKPKFKAFLGAEDLKSLKHLPIKQLCTNNLNIRKSVHAAKKFKEIFDEMSELREVHVWSSKASQDISIDSLEIIGPYVSSINTDAIATDKSELASRLMSMDLPKLTSITLFIGERRQPPFSKFTGEDLKIMGSLPITTVHMWSLKCEFIGDTNITFYPHVALFSEMKHLKEIVLDIYYMNKNQFPALRDLQSRGIVLTKGKWNEMYWKQLFDPTFTLDI